MNKAATPCACASEYPCSGPRTNNAVAQRVGFHGGISDTTLTDMGGCAHRVACCWDRYCANSNCPSCSKKSIVVPEVAIERLFEFETISSDGFSSRIFTLSPGHNPAFATPITPRAPRCRRLVTFCPELSANFHQVVVYIRLAIKDRWRRDQRRNPWRWHSSRFATSLRVLRIAPAQRHQSEPAGSQHPYESRAIATASSGIPAHDGYCGTESPEIDQRSDRDVEGALSRGADPPDALSSTLDQPFRRRTPRPLGRWRLLNAETSEPSVIGGHRLNDRSPSSTHR